MRIAKPALIEKKEKSSHKRRAEIQSTALRQCAPWQRIIVISQICPAVTGLWSIASPPIAVQITGNWPITLSPALLQQWSSLSPRRSRWRGPVSPCLSGSGMSPLEGLQSTSLKGMSCRESCPSPRPPSVSKFFHWAAEAERRPVIYVKSVLKLPFSSFPLLPDNPTPLSRLCWSCQSVQTLHTAVITISNCSLALYSLCHMSLGLKLVVMTFFA